MSMSKLAECMVYLCVIIALFVGARLAGAQEAGQWWLWKQEHLQVVWVPWVPAQSYDDCVERLLPKAFRFFDHTMSSNFPKLKCEVHND